MGVFTVKDSISEFEATASAHKNGSGITQVLWSACGRYLCIVERDSEGIGVWDVRGSGRRLSWLQKRNGCTNQRLGVDISGTDIWAGGTDGMVRIWENFGSCEGVIDPARKFRAHNGVYLLCG